MKNEFTINGYANNIKSLESGNTAFAVTYGVKVVGENDEYKNVFFNALSAKNIEIKANTRLTFKGFFTGNFYEKDGKEISNPQMFIQEVIEEEEKVNTLEVTGYVNNLKDLKNGQKIFGLSVSSKQKDGTYKNFFINCITKKDFEITNKERYTIKGFLSGSFFMKKKTVEENGQTVEKEVEEKRPQIFVMEATKEEKKSE